VVNNNVGRISHRFRDMAGFPLETDIYPNPPFDPEFENVSLALDR